MKNLLGLIMLIFLFTSCGKDLADDITGTWNAVSITYSDCVEASENLVFAYDDMGCFDDGAFQYCLQFTFSKDGSFNQRTTISDGQTEPDILIDAGNYTVDEALVTFLFDGEPITGTASIDGDTMTVSSQQEECTLSIIMIRVS